MLPLLTVNGMPFDAAPLTVTTKLPVPAAQELPSCTTIFWNHSQVVPQETTRRHEDPFQVRMDVPWVLPKKFPYKVTEAPEKPLTLSPPELGPADRSEKNRAGGVCCAAATMAPSIRNRASHFDRIIFEPR